MNLAGAGKTIAVLANAAPKLEKLRKASQDVEAVFLKDLLAEMQKGIKKVTFGDSTGSEIYQDMLNDVLSRSVSKSGNFGIGKTLYQQFSKEVMRQEAARVRAASMEAHNPIGEEKP